MVDWIGGSMATGQRSLRDPGIDYPLWPPLTLGCPRTSTGEIAYPVEVVYDYPQVQKQLFDPPLNGDLARWAPLLPPLTAGTGLGEGGTALVELSGLVGAEAGDRRFGVYVKDESRNPTWSHKDRLNRCAVSAAVGVRAGGIVVASSGNHGASAAAYAARAGLRCVVLVSASAPPAIRSFLAAYGAVVLALPQEARWPIMRRIVDHTGFHPVGSYAVTPTGHPFGVEGYKTIAFEVFAQLAGAVPDAVFIPVGHGDLLFGVWKGFWELRRLGVARTIPRMFACEPGELAPLAKAVGQGLPVATVAARDTAAFSIASTVSGFRGVVAVGRSGGAVMTVTEEEIRTAARTLAHRGLWPELSAAASVAGLHRALVQGLTFSGPVVCVSTSSGFKDGSVGSHAFEVIRPDWSDVRRRLHNAGITTS